MTEHNAFIGEVLSEGTVYRAPVPEVVRRIFRARSDLMRHGFSRPEHMTLRLDTYTAHDVARALFGDRSYPVPKTGDHVFGFPMEIDDTMDGKITLRYEVTV
jgi:hypothetical protein